MHKKTTGQQVRAARERLEMTQAALVEALAKHGCDVTVPFISLLENDQRGLAVQTAGALSVVLSIPLDDLLAQYKEPSP